MVFTAGPAKIIFLLALLGFGGKTFSQQKFLVKGRIMSADSVNGASFAYVINANTHNGVIADLNGNFTIVAAASDSLVVKMLGYDNLRFAINSLKNENDSVKAFKRFYLRQTAYQLNTVYINTFKLKPNERDYMKRVINRPKVEGINVAESPLTALWQAFSKKGKEMQKLQEIFENLLEREEIEKKVNTDILRQLLNDDSITMEQFRIACPEITDEFILYTEGYDLYSTITNSYKNWKKRK
jgi:hypothetical protein